MKNLICLCIAAAVLLLPVTFAAAQGEFDEEGRRVYYKPVTEIDINDEAAIEGVLHRPHGQLFHVLPEYRGKALLKLRQDFNPEMMQSVHSL
jgi:hypothetical protein